MNAISIEKPDENKPFERPERWIANHLKSDPRAYICTNNPLICLEFDGEQFEEVVSYFPDPEKNHWMWEGLWDEGYDPILDRPSYPNNVLPYECIISGWTPGYRIWATYSARGVKSYTEYGVEWDIEWDIDVLWEDRPAWEEQVQYITELCLEMGGKQL